ncbi:MAG TPA: thioredoxin family protein [Tepidisphaeraceae bacterium]|nr:thioredoxin family protein [Tepidisphaeraceae bacterium]
MDKSPNSSTVQKHPFRPVWLLVALLTGLCGIMLARSFIWHDIIPWRENYTTATREAQSRDVPRLLYFTAAYCEPCEVMGRTTWADQRVADTLKNYVPVKIDFPSQGNLDAEFGVDGTPTLVVVDPRGHVLRAISGELNADEFLHWLKDGQIGFD